MVVILEEPRFCRHRALGIKRGIFVADCKRFCNFAQQNNKETVQVAQYINSDTALPLILACLALVIAIIELTVYLPRVIKVSRTVKAQGEEPVAATGYPKASIVIYSHNDADGIAELLPQLLRQDYPEEYEIIVVNDGRDDSTEALLNSLDEGDIRIYHTFTPRDTRNVSRKKLALTLGIKAASHEAIVHITSATRVTSATWLRRMAYPLGCDGTDVVIGYATSAEKDGNSSRTRDDDRLIDSVHYLSAALKGKTYRGDGNNLAYRRSTFFALKGFSNSLNLHYGDDDIFVADASAPDNTVVMISPDAQVKAVSDNPADDYMYSKLRHAFTAKFAGTREHLFYGFCSLLMWCWLASGAAAVILAPLNPVTCATVAASALALWIPVIISWNNAAKALQSRKFMFSVPVFLMWRPIRNFVYLLKSKKIHDAQYAWQTTN